MDDVVDDIDSRQRMERQTLREDAELFASMITHKGWTRYLQMIDKVAQNYHATVMKPIENVLESPRIEHAKGVLTGLSVAAQLPQMKMNEARELLPPQPYEED